jgi:hypothetical protein
VREVMAFHHEKNFIGSIGKNIESKSSGISRKWFAGQIFSGNIIHQHFDALLRHLTTLSLPRQMPLRIPTPHARNDGITKIAITSPFILAARYKRDTCFSITDERPKPERLPGITEGAKRSENLRGIGNWLERMERRC